MIFEQLSKRGSVWRIAFLIVVVGSGRVLTRMSVFNQNSNKGYYLLFMAEFLLVFTFKFSLDIEDQSQTLHMLGWPSARLLKLFKSVPLTNKKIDSFVL